nr:hypothetical protein [uncultured Dongia sp.]
MTFTTAKRDIVIQRKHVAALSALTINPAHAPVDGLCLEELRRMGLIQPVDGGYSLTREGQQTLAAEKPAAHERNLSYSAEVRDPVMA